MITSSRNTKIQWVRSLQSRARERRVEQLFVVEGVRLVEEALNAGLPAKLVLYTSDLSERGHRLLEGYAAQSCPVEKVSPQVMRYASDTQTPQGILAVLPMQSLPIPSGLDFIFIPDGISDPGNLGSMLRTAAAAGVGAILLPPNTMDVYSPKVVRAAMGAHFGIPIILTGWEEIRDLAKGANLKVFLADITGEVDYTYADFRSPVALIVGGEAEGASKEAINLAQERVHIPMAGRCESLNAAVAAAILLFEVVRQRHR